MSLDAWIAVGDRTVGCHLNSQGLRALAEFYKPYYVFSRPSISTPFIVVEGKVELSAKSATASVNIDDYLVPAKCVRRDHDVVVFDRSQMGLTITIDRTRRRIVVVAKDQVSLDLQIRVLLRDQVFRRIETTQGYVTFHGSAVEQNGAIVAFMGPRNAGKTVSLLTLLLRRRFNFVSADRLSIRRELSTQGARIRGIPARCNVHLTAFQSGQQLHKIRDRMDFNQALKGKILVEIDDLCSLASVTIQAEGQLKLIVLPEIIPNVKGVQVECPSSINEIVALLAENLLEGTKQDLHGNWLGYFPPLSEYEKKEPLALCKAIAEGIRVVVVRANYEAYREWLENGAIEQLIK